MTTDPWGELINPQSPGGNECVSACGDSGCVFNASRLGGMGIQFLSGSGHIQYRGITPGSSEEMRAFSLFPSHSAMDKTNHTTKIQTRCNVCLTLLGGREFLEMTDDSKGFW